MIQVSMSDMNKAEVSARCQNMQLTKINTGFAASELIYSNTGSSPPRAREGKEEQPPNAASSWMSWLVRGAAELTRVLKSWGLDSVHPVCWRDRHMEAELFREINFEKEKEGIVKIHCFHLKNVL